MAAQNPDNSIARGRAGGGTSTHQWQDDAACRDTVGDLFFDPESFVEAKQVCRGCPVVDRCLDDALSNGLWDGVFGGLDPHERKAFAREAGMPRHGTASGYSTDGCRCGLCREWMAEAQRRSQQRRQEVAA